MRTILKYKKDICFTLLMRLIEVSETILFLKFNNKITYC